MIARMEGRLEFVGEDRILLSSQGISYEVWVPECACRQLHARVGETVLLHTIYLLQGFGMGNVQPVLIGFLTEQEKRFFQLLTSINGWGIKAALRLLSAPVERIAQAIEQADADYLKKLPGVGPRKAEELVMRLRGKAQEFVAVSAIQGEDGGNGEKAEAGDSLNRLDEVGEEVLTVLSQLGFARSESERLLREARRRRPEAVTTEALIREVFRRSRKVEHS